VSLKYPYILAILVPIIWLLYKSSRSSVGSSSIIFPISQRNFKARSRIDLALLIPFLFRVMGFIFLIFCLARPQSSSTHTKRSAEGIDIMIALDVSQSMLIEDVRGKNRLEIAKETVMRFIEGRSDDRIGFLMFSGEAVTLCPPTLDYDVLLKAVSSSNINLLKDGTAIGDALATSVTRLRDSTAKSKVIILITDGDNNMGAIAPLTAGEIAVGYGIKVYSIALGKEGLVNMPYQQQGIFGSHKSYRQMVSTINPELLVKISDETKGKFFRAGDANSMREVFEEINKLEKNQVETKSRVNWTEHYQFFLLVGLILLLCDLILRNTVFRILPG
jgi:Ca-activated chloride channel family protein